MAFQKFGTGPDQKTELDTKDEQGISKSALKRTDALTDQDRKELNEENQK